MGREPPAISVIMSVRDGMPFVAETIDSIINQTFTDWEFIINDNASTDGTGAYLLDRAKAEPRLRVLLNERDRGYANGYNNALHHAQAPWVAIIDGDDRALPERLQRQVDFVAKHPGIKVCSTLAYYIDSQGDRVARTHHDLTTPEAFEHYMAANEAIGILNPGAFVERDAMLDVGGYRDEFFPAADIDLWARLSELGMVLVIPEYLMEYRVHGSSSSARVFLHARMKYEWSRVCSAARRSGRPEPGWDEFLAEWNARPLPARLNSWRKITAKGMYRQAALDWISNKRVAALRRVAFGSLLQPTYVLNRLRQQALPASRRAAA